MERAQQHKVSKKHQRLPPKLLQLKARLLNLKKNNQLKAKQENALSFDAPSATSSASATPPLLSLRWPLSRRLCSGSSATSLASMLRSVTQRRPRRICPRLRWAPRTPVLVCSSTLVSTFPRTRPPLAPHLLRRRPSATRLSRRRMRPR